MVYKCSVPGCSTRGRGIKYYSVPFTNKKRWEEWLSLCPFLQNYPPTQRENIRFCHKHFIPEHIKQNLRLTPNAIPLVNLGNTDKYKVTNRDLILEIEPTSSITEPFIFKVVNPSELNRPTIEQNCSIIQEHQSSELSSTVSIHASLNEANSSTPTQFTPNIPHNTQYPICITPSTSTTIAVCNEHKLKSHSLVKRRLTNRIRLNPNECTPRKRILRSSIHILKNKLRLLQSRYKKLKTRFDLHAPKTKVFLKKYNILSTYGKLLVDSQLRLTGNSLKGRRYTDSEKVFALSLYKLSPKCYRFLRKHLALPCKSRINSLLSNIPLRPGINDFIFQHLADAALDKPAIDRQCTLMFDEMSIKKHLNFNFFTGVIEGFEDIGSGKRTNNVADKALVFMLRGLFSPWKIPIAFYFARDGVKTFVLKNIIKEIVLAVFKSGFIVRATISDQGSANVAAIKSLISDSNAELLRSNKYTNDICYKIGPNQLYHIYDVPHLLKCFRNNFQKKNLLIGNQRAKWEYIERLYKVDGFGGRARSTKLTEKHIRGKE